MTTQKARKHLLKLRRQLEQQDFTDSRSIERAKALTVLIDRAVKRDEEGATDYHELQRHLKDSVTLFEVSHPSIAAAINNIINTLNAMGV